MGTIAERVRQGKTVYQVRVRIAGYPTMTATFYSRREAERWAIKKEAEMIEGKHFRSIEARRRKRRTLRPGSAGCAGGGKRSAI